MGGKKIHVKFFFLSYDRCREDWKEKMLIW